MAINIQRFFLLIIGLLFCVLGCTREHDDISMLDDVEVAFEENILPILTARCAISGCHVADGPHGLDFRTYASFIARGEHGSVFIPGNAEESEVVKQIVSGDMPPGGPPLTAAEIQLFVDWINQQEAQDHVVQHEHHEHDNGHDNGHDDEHDDDNGHNNDDDN